MNTNTSILSRLHPGLPNPLPLGKEGASLEYLDGEWILAVAVEDPLELRSLTHGRIEAGIVDVGYAFFCFNTYLEITPTYEVKILGWLECPFDPVVVTPPPPNAKDLILVICDYKNNEEIKMIKKLAIPPELEKEWLDAIASPPTKNLDDVYSRYAIGEIGSLAANVYRL